MAEGVGPTVERPRALERATEALEQSPAVEQREIRPTERVAPSSAMAAPSMPTMRPAAPPKSPIREDIEAALADGLDRVYAELPPDRQAKFREEGERVAGKLEMMFTSGKVVLAQVHRLIMDWLKLLPRRSQAFAYFLIQEAKVKTDAILALARRS